jgi:hypothetical protein
MTKFLMDFIDYAFVAFVLAGATFAFGYAVWMVQEFSKGFLSVFIGMSKAEEIAAWIPYVISGLLIVLLMWKVGH